MIRGVLMLFVLLGLGYCSTEVPLGAPRPIASPGWPWSTVESRMTLAGHVRAIWHTEEVQDLKDGIEKEAGPAARDLKHKLHEVTADDPTKPVIDAGVIDARDAMTP
jgi:hypothetical protein